jgi:hypothetical protein
VKQPVAFVLAALLLAAPLAEAKSSKSSSSSSSTSSSKKSDKKSESSSTKPASKPASKPATKPSKAPGFSLFGKKPSPKPGKSPRPSPSPEHLPHDVWVRGDNAVLIFDLQTAPTIAREKGFKLKRGTHLSVSTPPKKDKYKYYVFIDDNERYPFSNAFDHNVTGYKLSGYIDRSSVQEKPYNNLFGVDELYAKKATSFKPKAGAPITLQPGTRLWAVTGKKEGSRYLVRMDDFKLFPNQTKARLEGYVEAADVAKKWSFTLPGKKR